MPTFLVLFLVPIHFNLLFFLLFLTMRLISLIRFHRHPRLALSSASSLSPSLSSPTTSPFFSFTQSHPFSTNTTSSSSTDSTPPSTMPNYTFETVKVSFPAPFVAHVELNRPKKMNAINGQMWKDIRSVFDTLKYDEDVRAIVLSGAGRAFTSGIDCKGVFCSCSAKVEPIDLCSDHLLPTLYSYVCLPCANDIHVHIVFSLNLPVVEDDASRTAFKIRPYLKVSIVEHFKTSSSGEIEQRIDHVSLTSFCRSHVEPPRQLERH